MMQLIYLILLNFPYLRTTNTLKLWFLTMSQKANYNTETYFIVINKHLQKVPHEKFITFDTSFIFWFFFSIWYRTFYNLHIHKVVKLWCSICQSVKRNAWVFFFSVLLKLYKTLATHKLLPKKNIIKHNIITYRNSWKTVQGKQY